jgi:homopolymeric O-antigen transport system ATP-binding protein
MKPIIRVENLSKSYELSKMLASSETLRDSIAEMVRTPFKRLRDRRSSSGETLWALKNINLEVAPGEVLGIIGRNGAGKSTLLKILSRITEPTAGRVELYGRVGSLLEVGTGFHPELTGRENIFLNSVILGMSHKEMKKNFDEIVAFAEIEKFIDTPVKRYSSGMYVRLAFAVAAHLSPEILIVDEVLAVGDLAFQNKCLGKMQDVSLTGRTVLFVSHNMPAITRLCSRAILLDSGSLVREGPTTEIVSAYVEGAFSSAPSREWQDLAQAPGTEELKLLSVDIIAADGSRVSTASVQDALVVRLKYVIAVPNLKFRCAVLFHTQGTCAFTSVEPLENLRERPGTYCSVVKVPRNLLAEGEYVIGVSIFSSRGIKQHHVRLENVVAFHVFDPMTGDSARGDYAEGISGVVRPQLEWESYFEGPHSVTEIQSHDALPDRALGRTL